MLDAIATALIIHLGKKTIDAFWSGRSSSQYSVVDQTGKLSYATSDGARTVVRPAATRARSHEYETIVGDLYLLDTVQELMTGNDVVLVLVIEETGQQVLFFEADANGYEIELLPGLYFILVFMMDAEEEDFMDAEIMAVGFPCAQHVELSGIEGFSLQDGNSIWDFVTEDPVRITEGGPFYLDFILIDTDEEPDLPKSFAELIR